jgi:hypothetical protein
MLTTFSVADHVLLLEKLWKEESSFGLPQFTARPTCNANSKSVKKFKSPSLCGFHAQQ